MTKTHSVFGVTVFCVCLTLLACTLPVDAQSNSKKETKSDTSAGDAMIYMYLSAETDRIEKKVFDGAKTLAEWKQRRPRLHDEYMYMLGLSPLPEKTPLQATVTGKVEAHGVVVENLHYQSMPGLYVTGNLYRPRDIKPGEKLPAIFYVCGHSNRGRDGNKTAFQDHGFWFANNGYICLVVDTLQLGEIPGVHHGTYGRPWNHLTQYGIKDKNVPETRWWWHCRGYTPAGVEAWNGIRGIDYLISRPDVDAGRIGVTGISGGGAATFWIAAADERVKVAVPVSGMSDLTSYVKNKVINGHCDCMFLYNTFGWDWTTIAALVAPRPMLFANSDNDRIFPMDGNRRIIGKLRKLYKMYGKPTLVDDYVSVGGHAYRPDLRIAIFKFFNTHLKNTPAAKVEDSEQYTDIEGKRLRVFPTDADIPKDAINARIDETFVPKARVTLPAKKDFAKWRKEMIVKLKTESLRNSVSSPRAQLVKIKRDFVGVLSLRTDAFIEVNGMVLPPASGKRLKVLLVPEFAHSSQSVKEDLRKKIETQAFGLVIAPRGTEESWSRKSPPNYVERSHVLLGHTVSDGRVRDVLSVLKWIQSPEAAKKLGIVPDPQKEVELVGQTEEGILAAYAALLDPSIDAVTVINPPTSHMQGPYFLNVLRVLDIPEALGLLAPRKLTIIGDDPAFDRTAEIYRLAGAADKLVRKQK